MEKIAIKVCTCEGEHKNFPTSIYKFGEIGAVELPDLCPNSDLSQNELTQFELLLETTEENQNWTLYSIYRGRIARIQENLFFYTFGDIDEIGESNFYIYGSLRDVVEYLLSEWGPLAPDWRQLFKNWAVNGIPDHYDPSELTYWAHFFEKPDSGIVSHLAGLYFSLFLKLDDASLKATLEKL